MFSKIFDRSSWSLFVALTRRDLTQRYRGSLMGLLWAFVTPLSLLAVYAFVFRSVFKARWPSVPPSGPSVGSVLQRLMATMLPEGIAFALNLFVGLFVLSAFGEVISRAPRLVLDHPQLVRRVVFPLPMLGFVLAATAFVQTFMQFLVLLFVLLTFMLFGVFKSELVMPNLALLSIELSFRIGVSVLILACLAPLLLGLSWLLAALGTYFRDIQYVTPAVMSFLMFLGPVFYPLSALPTDIQPWVYLNPITLIAEQIRAVLLLGASVDGWALSIYLGLTSMFACAAYCLFARVRKGFADVL